MALVPKHIKALSPYRSGRPIAEIKRLYGLDRIVKLDSNENPLGPSPKALAAARGVLKQCHRYPDSSGYELRFRLAERFHLRLENVILGAGSEGIMSAIMRTFLSSDDEIIAARDSFIGFRVLAAASGARTNWIPKRDHHYDLPAMAEAINEYTKIIYLANPDNPTGTHFTVAEFDAFMSRVPERVLIILDEAYFEFAQGQDSYPDSMHYRYDNVITLRTFSKAYGLAGFRVGYGFAHGDLIGNLLKVKLPFEPSVPAQTAALAALEDTEFLRRTLENNRREKPRLRRALSGLGITVLPSLANFVTLIFPDPETAETFSRDLLQRGVLVRYLEPFGLPDSVRVSIGRPAENRFFLEQARTLLKTYSSPWNKTSSG